MSDSIGLLSVLVLGAALFAIGLVGFLVRRNLIIMFLSTEVMLQGVIVTVVGFGRFYHNLRGQAFAVFLLVLAAVEAAVGLGLVVLMFRRSGTLDSEAWRSLKE